MKLNSLPEPFFTDNRCRLATLLEAGSMLVICGGRRVPRSGKQFYPFRQQSDFFYLTGIGREDSALVMFRDHPESAMREILFLRDPDPDQQIWTGPQISREEAIRISGITHIRYLADLDGVLDELAPAASSVYFNHPQEAPASGFVSPDEEVFLRVTSRYTGLVAKSVAPLMMQLRMIKSKTEVEVISTACRITGSAFRRALGVLRPGVAEYEIEAELTAEFIRRGTGGHAFEPIVASGKNALILHYTENSQPCNSGDLLLMDFGAEVNNYAADCTRTVPVNGRFSVRQRALYDAVVRVFGQARSMMVPGTTLAELHGHVGRLWEEEHIRLGIYSLQEARSALRDAPLWKKYFMHGTSHSLGLDVHDPFDRSTPLAPGMVLTCEPAIYLPEESTGIRLENDILVTAEGPVDLMEHIPVEAEEIENLMQELAPARGSMERPS